MKSIFRYLIIIFAVCVVLGARVTIDGTDVFTISEPSGDQTAEERASRITDILDSLLVDRSFSIDSLLVIPDSSSYTIVAGAKKIVSVTIVDTTGTGMNQQTLAEKWRDRIRAAIQQKRKTYSSPRTFVRFALLVLYPVFLIVIFLILRVLAKAFSRFTMNQEGRLVKGVRIGRLQILTPENEVREVLRLTIFLKYAIFVLIFYFSLLIFLRQFDVTNAVVREILDTTLTWIYVAGIWLSKIAGVLLKILVLYIVARLLNGLVGYFSRHYKDVPTLFGRLNEAGYQALLSILRRTIFVLFLLAVVYIIPGGKTFAMALFFTLVFIVGLSFIPLLRDLFAGYIMMARNLIRVGRTIEFDGNRGRVVQRKLVYTVIRLPDDSIVIVHNNYLLSKPVHVFVEESHGGDE